MPDPTTEIQAWREPRPALDPRSSRARILELEEEVTELREKLASAVWQLEAYRRIYGDNTVVE